MSPSFAQCVVFVGIQRAERAVIREHIAFEVEPARLRGQGGETMIPAFALDRRLKRVYPDRERRRNGGRVFVEFVVRREPQLRLELGVSLRPALALHEVKSPLEVVR